MEKKAIARLICDLIESRDWEAWQGKGIRECTYLDKGQISLGIQYLAKKGYVTRDNGRGRGWWRRTRKFLFWKYFLGIPTTKLDMSTGKLKYA